MLLFKNEKAVFIAVLVLCTILHIFFDIVIVCSLRVPVSDATTRTHLCVFVPRDTMQDETLPAKKDSGQGLQASRPVGTEHKLLRDMAAIAAGSSPQGSWMNICSPPGKSRETRKRESKPESQLGSHTPQESTEGKANASHQAPISTSVMGEAAGPVGS